MHFILYIGSFHVNIECQRVLSVSQNLRIHIQKSWVEVIIELLFWLSGMNIMKRPKTYLYASLLAAFDHQMSKWYLKRPRIRRREARTPEKPFLDFFDTLHRQNYVYSSLMVNLRIEIDIEEIYFRRMKWIFLIF